MAEHREKSPFAFNELPDQPRGQTGHPGDADAAMTSGGYAVLPGSGLSEMGSLRRFATAGGRSARAHTTTTASVDDAMTEDMNQEEGGAAVVSSFMAPYGSTSFADSKVRISLARTQLARFAP